VHIFLSYDPADRETVGRLRSELMDAGYDVWWDQDILPGQYHHDEISRALKNASAVLACFSDQAQLQNSRFYQEIRAAIQVYRGKPPGSIFLIPIRISNARVPDIPIDSYRDISDLNALDLFPGSHWDNGIKKLIYALEPHRDNKCVPCSSPLLSNPGLKAELDVLRGKIAWSSSLFDALSRDRVFITGLINHPKTNRWLMQVKLPEFLSETYGTAPEALILLVDGEFGPRDLEAAKEELQKREFQLDRDLLLVVDSGPDLEERLANSFGQSGQWIPLVREKEKFPSLEEIFRKHVATYDIFDERYPVRGRQVFGREVIVSDLIKRIRRGSAVGIYGLRKIGKTTVVRAATDQLDGPGNTTVLPVVWLDAERVYEPTLEALAAITSTLIEKKARELPELLDIPSAGQGSAVSRLDQLLSSVLEHLKTPLCLVIDEYDYLFEGGGGTAGVKGIATFYRMLRGHAQETGKLALVTIGRDPSRLDEPVMEGQPNPMLGWFLDCWPGPLSEADTGLLLIQLGKRVGLEIGPETVRHAFRWTGGHPLLARQLGSVLLELSREGGSRSDRLATDPFLEEAMPLFLERGMVLTICREVNHLLTARYPRAADLLSALTQTPALHQKTHRERGAHTLLRRFGLLVEDGDTRFVPELFRWYWTTMLPGQRVSA